MIFWIPLIVDPSGYHIFTKGYGHYGVQKISDDRFVDFFGFDAWQYGKSDILDD